MKILAYIKIKNKIKSHPKKEEGEGRRGGENKKEEEKEEEKGEEEKAFYQKIGTLVKYPWEACSSIVIHIQEVQSLKHRAFSRHFLYFYLDLELLRSRTTRNKSVFLFCKLFSLISFWYFKWTSLYFKIDMKIILRIRPAGAPEATGGTTAI